MLREGLSDDGLFVDPSVTHHEKRLVVDGMIRQEEDSVKGGTEAPKSTVSGPRNSTILNPPTCVAFPCVDGRGEATSGELDRPGHSDCKPL